MVQSPDGSMTQWSNRTTQQGRNQKHCHAERSEASACAMSFWDKQIPRCARNDSIKSFASREAFARL
jgi:hypothetical protein